MNSRVTDQAPPRLCATCGLPPAALIHTGDHPTRCHSYTAPRISILAVCTNPACRWYCTCDTPSQALEEAEEHERTDAGAVIDFQEVTR